MDTNIDIRKVVAAGALAGILGFGGASVASAQTDDSTTSTTEGPSVDQGTTPAPDDGGATDEARPGCDDDTDTSTGRSSDTGT